MEHTGGPFTTTRMPPRGGRKVRFDAEAGTGDSDRSKEKKKSRKSGEKSAPLAAEVTTPLPEVRSPESLKHQPGGPQVVGFASEQELSKYARGIGLTRLSLTDLYQQSNLDTSYCGGQVIGHFSNSYSQGHELGVFIEDESATEGSQSEHLVVTISDELAEGMPRLSSDAMMFVHKAIVKDSDGQTCSQDPQAFSQDHGKCLWVGGSEARVWIVHKDVHRLMQSTQRSCRKRWWKKTKERREKIKSKW